MRVFFILFQVLVWFIAAISPRRKKATELRFSAGAKGWELLAINEIYLSASEWLSPEKVTKVVYRESLSVRDELGACSHFFYDAGTGYDQSKSGLKRKLSCYFRALKICLVGALRGITVIGFISDFGNRNLRVAGFIATAGEGHIVTSTSPRAVPPRFLLHKRISGPTLMPFSVKTVESINGNQWQDRERLISFVGTPYGVRANFLQEISEACAEAGLEFSVFGRAGPTGERVSNGEYWRIHTNSTFTIALNFPQPAATGEIVDFPEVENLVGRVTEAVVAGCCLLSDMPAGIERLLRPHEHFVPIETPDDVIEVLLDYSKRPEFYETIARSGRLQAEALAGTAFFWNSLNTALGKHAMF